MAGFFHQRGAGQVEHREIVAFETLPADGVGAGIGDHEIRCFFVHDGQQQLDGIVAYPTAGLQADAAVNRRQQVRVDGGAQGVGKGFDGGRRQVIMRVRVTRRPAEGLALLSLRRAGRLQPFPLFRPVPAADIDKCQGGPVRRRQIRQDLSQGSDKRHLGFRRKVPAGVKLQPRHGHPGMATGSVQKGRQILQGNAEFAPQTGGVHGQTHAAAHRGGHFGRQGRQALQFAEAVHQDHHPVGMGNRQAQLVNGLSRTAEDNVGGAQVQGHFQLQATRHIQPEPFVNQDGGHVGVVVAFDREIKRHLGQQRLESVFHAGRPGSQDGRFLKVQRGGMFRQDLQIRLPTLKK